MTVAAWVLLASAGVAAVTDWVAVATHRKRLEYAAKPATLVLLLACALVLEPADGAVRAWFVVALLWCLAGDVLLLVPERFVLGLAAFLLGHLAYVAGFVAGGQRTGWLVVGIGVVAVALATVGRRVIGAVRRGERRALTAPVAAYMVAISAMVATAFGSAVGVAVVGAVLFYASDAMIAEREFVQRRAWLPVAIIVTYHLGQAALVLSLTS